MRAAAAPLLSELCFSVGSYAARVEGVAIRPQDLIGLLRLPARFGVRAIDSNYWHICQPGHESRGKRPVAGPRKKVRPAPAGKRARDREGDGTCFNSSMLATVAVRWGGREEIYRKLRFFPSTGETQVTGCSEADFADGRAVLREWLRYVRECFPRRALQGAPRLVNPRAIMRNYKFRMNVAESIDVRRLRDHVDSGQTPPPGGLAVASALVCRDKLTVLFRTGPGKPTRVAVFASGKINILGGKKAEHAVLIHEYFARLALRGADFVHAALESDPDSSSEDPLPAEPLRCGLQGQQGPALQQHAGGRQPPALERPGGGREHVLDEQVADDEEEDQQ